MEEELVCNSCDWHGDSSELESKTSDLKDNLYNHCPDCGSDDLSMINAFNDAGWTSGSGWSIGATWN